MIPSIELSGTVGQVSTIKEYSDLDSDGFNDLMDNIMDDIDTAVSMLDDNGE